MNSDNSLMFRPVVLKGEFGITNAEFMDYFEPHFASQLRDYSARPMEAVQKARYIACSSMKIERRYFCRSIDTLHIPLSPQQQRDMFIKVGLKMSVPTVIRALDNADVESEDINCIIFVSHAPFPFPPFTAHLMSKIKFNRDCAQIPVTSMGCAGGGFAMDAALTYLTAHPTHNVLVLCLELCSIGFRPHRKGMSWFLNSALFGDAVGAFVCRGAECQWTDNVFPCSIVQQLVHSKQRLIPGTTHVSYFNYDEWGYDFVTTQGLCDVVREHCPEFANDLSREAFGKSSREITLNVIHPGGTRMIREVGGKLHLGGTRSEKLAKKCMADGGNIASVSVIDMIAREWDQFEEGDEIVVVGMGPGFVLCGASMRAMSLGESMMHKTESSSGSEPQGSPSISSMNSTINTTSI